MAFHGHACGGLTIGFQAARYAMELLELDFSADEDVVCIAENDACGVDAIQVLLGCSVGKGNLLFHLRGKQAFSFYNRKTGKAVRLSPADSFAGIYTAIHGLALLGARRFAEALPHLRASVSAFAEYSGHYNTLISCCGHLGLIDEAQEFIAARARVGPPLHLSVLRENLRHYAHCEVFVEGMRKAGVPE